MRVWAVAVSYLLLRAEGNLEVGDDVKPNTTRLVEVHGHCLIINRCTSGQLVLRVLKSMLPVVKMFVYERILAKK